MPWFSYSAITESGATIKGRMEADTQQAVITLLKQQQLLPIAARPLRDNTAIGGFLSAFDRGHVGLSTRIDFCKFTADLLNSGLSLAEAMNTLAASPSSRAEAALLNKLRPAILAGDALTAALVNAGLGFDRYLIATIRAGEASGQLAHALHHVAEHLTRRQAQRQRLQRALAYPIFILILTVASVAVMATMVIPRFAHLFAQMGQELPVLTQSLMRIAGFVESAIIPSLLIAIFSWFMWRLGARNNTIAWYQDKVLLSLPVVGPLRRRVEVQRFLDILAVLLGQHIQMADALRLARDSVTVRPLQQRLDDATSAILNGASVAGALTAQGLIGMRGAQIIRVGEQSARLADKLTHFATDEAADIEQLLQKYLAMLGPVLILLLGALVGAVMVSVLSAFWDLTSLATI